MKAEKIREMSADELKTQRRELKEQLFKLRMQKSTGQLDNPARLREIRRDIARLETIQKEKASRSAGA